MNLQILNVPWMDLEQKSNAVQEHLDLGKDINLMTNMNCLCEAKITMVILVYLLNTALELVSCRVKSVKTVSSFYPFIPSFLSSSNLFNQVFNLLVSDNTAPTIVLTSTEDLQTSSPTIKWTSSEEVQFKCTLDDGRPFDCGDGQTGSWTGSNLPDGAHKFLIEGKDEVLNTGKHTFTWNKGKELFGDHQSYNS